MGIQDYVLIPPSHMREAEEVWRKNAPRDSLKWMRRALIPIAVAVVFGSVPDGRWQGAYVTLQFVCLCGYIYLWLRHRNRAKAAWARFEAAHPAEADLVFLKTNPY